jgi:hypothetical protein
MSDLLSRVFVHGTSVVLGPSGRAFGAPEEMAVLLLGESGGGKSDVALRLIHSGAKLIADDQTALFIRGGVRGGQLYAAAPDRTRGLLEVRGVGIVPVEAAAEAPIALVVQLSTGEIPRMPTAVTYSAPPPLRPMVSPVFLTLNPFEASTPAKILAAAAVATKGRPGLPSRSINQA